MAARVSRIEAELGPVGILVAMPMRRCGDPQEYADVVALLASDRASYITGSQIRVDGGYVQSI